MHRNIFQPLPIFAVLFGTLALLFLSPKPAHCAPKDPASCASVLRDFRVLQASEKKYQQLRFLKPLNGLASLATGSRSIDETIESLMKSDGRKHTFFLEGLFKVFKDIYGDEFGDWRDQVKAFEDALGAYDDAATFLNYAAGKNRTPEYVLLRMTEKRTESKDKLRALLLKEGWFYPNGQIGPKFLSLARFVLDTKWHPFNTERDEIVDAIVANLKGPVDHAKDTRVEDIDFDMTVLQGDSGIHKLRRELRWILIYMQAFDGLFELVDNPLPLNMYASIVDNARVANSPFARLQSNPLVKNTIQIPQHVFLAISEEVRNLGVIKSVGEKIEALEEVFLESDKVSGERRARERAEALVGETFDSVVEKAKAVKRSLRDTGLLKEFRKLLQAQR